MATARRTSFRALIPVVGLVLAALGGATPLAAQIYPDPPPDFSHPGIYHDTPLGSNDPLYSPLGGTLDRPMLVIYVHFSDVAERAGEDAEWVRERFFGPGYPSVAAWYAANSFGRLTLFPAAETQGTANDGVVVVDAGAFDSYVDQTTPWTQRNRTAVELADPHVDFSIFDSDSDGTITDAELLIVNIRVAREGFVRKINGPVCTSFPSLQCPEACDPSGDPCASWDIGEVANRGVAAGAPLDGVAVALNVPMASTASNFITWVHEITHSTLHLVDLYAFGVGTLDIAGPTLDAPDRFEDRNRRIFSACAWSKVHWGWITPTVVTSDGYYDVPSVYTTGAAFILYDPDHGVDDYFIVENRRRIPGSYDRDASDGGLVIWRIDEQNFNPPSGSSGPEGGPIARRSPNGQEAAWDPSDPDSPERTMTSPWRDGTANSLAVRAIGPAGGVMRAYFDVRGPGVLVDTYPLDADGPYVVVAGQAGTVPLPVMNTGEAGDSFEFSLSGLPAGWTTEPYASTLSPVVEDVAEVELTPANDAPVGVHSLTATGASETDPAVTSSSGFDVEVVHRSDLAVLDVTPIDPPAELLVGESASLAVETRVTNHGPTWPTDATLSLDAAAASGGSVAPASETDPVPGLELDEIRVFGHDFTVSCNAPGVQAYAFTAEIQPVAAEDVDADAGNNTAVSTVEVECVVPVAINIKPHSDPNSVEPGNAGVVPVAVLSTGAGEYGLPLPFDALTIVPLTVRFGPRSLVWPESGGAEEVHGTGHLEDSYELDERTRDRDLDMVLHFGTPDSGIQVGDVEACVKGRWLGGGTQPYKFFGCDSVRTTPE